MNLCRDESVPEQVGVVFPPFFSHGRAHGCAAAWIVLLLLPETMWCLRLLLLVVLLPWSSSVKREHTPAGTPLITEWFGEGSSPPADAVTSATPTSPLPPCRLIEGHVGENVRLLLPFALCKMFFLTTRIPTAHTHPSCHPPRRPRLQYRTSLGTNFAGASIYRKEVQLYGRRVALKLYSTSKRTAW